MKKLYIEGNYFVIDDTVSIVLVQRKDVNYIEDSTKFTIQTTPIASVLDITFIDSVNWYDAEGLTAYDEDSMRAFLRTNTGR